MAAKNIDSILEQFGISKNGFLPKGIPPKSLPHYFSIWDTIAYDLPHLNATRQTRKIIDENLVLLDHEQLETEEQLQRAYLVLCMLSHSYIWCMGDDNVATILPKSLAVPWWHVSKRLGITPVLTHAAVDLYNWKLIDDECKDGKDPIHLDNIRCIHTMTGTMDEEWFFLIMTDIEKKAYPIFVNILEIEQLLKDDNSSNVDITKRLNDIASIIDSMRRSVIRMHEKCKPETFYHVLRPYLRGSENNDLLPNGLVYDGVNNNEPMRLAGGSAAQSSVIPVIDAALQISHGDAYFNKIRAYMPDKHREFISYVAKNVSIKDRVDLSFDHPELVEAYNKCITELTKFRRAHFGLVHKYILEQIQKKPTDKSSDDHTTSTTLQSSVDGTEAAEAAASAVGTGGTDLNKFLKGAIDETLENKYDLQK